ncbi:hypothetical protein, partial [Salmonella sp. s54925]|uniref:hypothetical protein n=1 Tax=Salmonella sp. s54925 TaxID=3159674 RepID=UPI00397ED2AB
MSMGRVLFYIIAIIVACCAVAVVLFETDAGLELVAKIRGGENSGTGESYEPKTQPPSETENKIKDSTKDNIKTRTEESANSKQENVESRTVKDTSSKINEHLYEEQMDRRSE